VIDEALRNVVAVGGDPARTAILDNFSWGNCDKPDRLGALVLAAQGCYDAAALRHALRLGQGQPQQRVPASATRRIAIPPTLLVTALAIVPDVARR
jgi:phosphoribosylformylglycinamidine synthase